MVPFLLLLSAEGVRILWTKPRYRVPIITLAGIFIAAAITKNYRHLTDRGEDWNRLSAYLSEASPSAFIAKHAVDVLLRHDLPLELAAENRQREPLHPQPRGEVLIGG